MNLRSDESKQTLSRGHASSPSVSEDDDSQRSIHRSCKSAEDACTAKLRTWARLESIRPTSRNTRTTSFDSFFVQAKFSSSLFTSPLLSTVLLAVIAKISPREFLARRKLASKRPKIHGNRARAQPASVQRARLELVARCYGSLRLRRAC